MKEILESSGDFKHYDGTTGPISTLTDEGINGFDGVFVKGTLDNPTEIIINESKQFTGSVKLSNGTATNPAQMTREWVRKVMDTLLESSDPTKVKLAEAIEKAQLSDNLTKNVSMVDRTASGNANNLLGGVAIVKVLP